MLFRLIMILILIGAPVSADIITIMSANITSGNNSAYEGPGIRIFQGLQPDIVLIQEFNYRSGSLRDLVDEAFGAEYDYYVEGGSENIPNGIISRFPILSSGEWNDSHVSDRDFAWAVIDIPGDVDLQVVSVHLKTSDTTTQNAQAMAIRDYVTAHFDPSQFIVVGGDMNTASRYASAITTFDTFLDPHGHTPADQDGRSATSEPRTKPYDWVIPNDYLDDYHVPLVIGSSTYPEGLVFDSHVYTPLDEVYPVQYNDSHVTGMQHMAVMRAFDVGHSATPTPQPTSTPPVSDPVVDLQLNSAVFHGGDPFQLMLRMTNDDQARDVARFIVLDVFDNYFFYPGWTETVDWSNIHLDAGEDRTVNILNFTWPANTGSAYGLFFYAALTTRDDFLLVSNVSEAEFGYSD